MLFQKSVSIESIPVVIMDEVTSKFASQPTPPCFAPRSESYPVQMDTAQLHEPPTPPLRRSIFPHPQNSTWHVNVVSYSPVWSSQFEAIATHLRNLFATSEPSVPYLTIEHIGSTSVPGLAAKPNIDVLATFDSVRALESAVEALNWEIPKSPPFARYTQVPGGGGIPGRESFKLYLPTDSPYYAMTPERSLYLIADIEENKIGQKQIRCYRTLRDVLRQTGNRDLLEEYSNLKFKLGLEAFGNAFEYSARKDCVVRKILCRGGWTMQEVDEKENASRREWVIDDNAPY